MQQASRPLHLPGPRILPTGFVTLLFSDIEGSTMRWEAYPEGMRAALRRHDKILQSSIEAHGGHVFKTVGDEFCAVFDEASSAAAAAVAAQRALCAEDWSAVRGIRVRMAIHGGTTDERDGDYYGSTVNRVARLLSASHGGQILVSSVSAAALTASLPEGVELRDLGRHRLRDFPDLDAIYQLVAPELPDLFSPLRTIAERPTNLPQNLTHLLGRDEDLEHIKALLLQGRLASVVGAGGVGKTSIALRTGEELLQSYEDGAWLVELASLTDAASVAPAIAGVLRVTSQNGSPLEAIAAYLKTKTLLLILDNCEHLVNAVAQSVHEILRACPHVRVLVTSREPLCITGEAVYRLPSLDVASAASLFVERARAHVPSFELTASNADLIGRICTRLDGIALAIELAAPRLRVLSLQQLFERLDERFRILTGGSRTALPRQQTMRALIDWSYELLSEGERTMLQRVAVFAGGWTLGSAMDVCAGEGIEAWDMLDHLTSLADKSLIVTDSTGPESRYRILESTREYALERLEQSGERETFSRKHAEHCLEFARHADAEWSGMNAQEWIAPLVAELDNFRAALSWTIQRHADEWLGVALFGALEAFWWDAQPIEGRRWVSEMSSVVESMEPGFDAARFWLAAANIALTLRRQKAALENAERAWTLYRNLGDELGIAAALRCRGAALINLGRIDEGEVCVAEALETFRARGNRRLIALALRSLGLAPALRDDNDRAAPIFREALDYAQRLGDERGVQILSGNLAEIEFHSGNYGMALEYGREALDIARNRHDRVTICALLINLCAYCLASNRLDEARSLGREALESARDVDSELHFGIAIQHLAALGALTGDFARAARLLGYSDAVYRNSESKREQTEENEYRRTLAAISESLPAEQLHRALHEGSTLTQSDALGEALLI